MGGYDAQIFLPFEFDAALQEISHSLRTGLKLERDGNRCCSLRIFSLFCSHGSLVRQKSMRK